MRGAGPLLRGPLRRLQGAHPHRHSADPPGEDCPAEPRGRKRKASEARGRPSPPSGLWNLKAVSLRGAWPCLTWRCSECLGTALPSTEDQRGQAALFVPNSRPLTPHPTFLTPPDAQLKLLRFLGRGQRESRRRGAESEALGPSGSSPNPNGAPSRSPLLLRMALFTNSPTSASRMRLRTVGTRM